jgi:crotonobetaine/carnitine-CoA ligase
MNTDTDILALVQRACEEDPQLAVLIFDDGLSVTRERLWSEIRSFAGYLEERTEAGQRVAIMLENRTEFMIAWLACVASRTVLVSMNPTAQLHDAKHILQDADVRIAITDAEHSSLFEDLRPECPSLGEVIIVEGDEPGGLSQYRGTWSGHRDSSAGQDLTNVYYTSGTTGPPKGCTIDHEYWLHFTELVIDLYSIGPNDRMLCCLQFFYNDPPWQLLMSLKARTSLVVMRRFSVSRYWNVVRANEVTVLFGIASTALLLLKAPVSDLDHSHKVRLAVQVGIPAPLHQELVDRWNVPWVEGYGLTETGLVVAMPVELADEMIGSGSIGLPCRGVDLKIVDSDGRDVPPGVIGEMVLRAPGLMRGYLNRPEANEEAFRGGWFHTGDLGKSDENGFLYFQGRNKDIVRRNGENIAAAEVENVLRGHPKVIEAAVIAVPDDLRGEEVKVFVLVELSSEQGRVTGEDLIEFCTTRLARYKIPRFVEFRTDDFARTPSMRVKKQELSREVDDVAMVWDRERALGW